MVEEQHTPKERLEVNGRKQENLPLTFVEFTFLFFLIYFCICPAIVTVPVPFFFFSGQLVRGKDKSINKIGHALHDVDPAFRKFSRSPKMLQLLKTLGYQKPTPVQSM